MTWIHPACHRAKAKAQKRILLWNLSFKTIKKTKVVKRVWFFGGGSYNKYEGNSFRKKAVLTHMTSDSLSLPILLP